jgi:hypothetical protein
MTTSDVRSVAFCTVWDKEVRIFARLQIFNLKYKITDYRKQWIVLEGLIVDRTPKFAWNNKP